MSSASAVAPALANDAPANDIVVAEAASEGAPARREITSRLPGVVVERYLVRGVTGEELMADLGRRGPSGFHGFTNWAVDYRYQFQTDGTTCRITTVRTAIKGRVLLPQWADEARAPAELREDWQRYEAALVVHEEGHLANGHALMQALQRELGSLTADSCDALRTRTDAAARRLVDQHKERDRRYDAQTQHGATQGARLVVR